MGDSSSIEWTDATWNPIRGCSRVSEGCRNCYAERTAIRHAGDEVRDPEPGSIGVQRAAGAYHGLVKSTPSGPRWTGEVRFVESALDAPLRWKKPRRIFVNSMSDLFHEKVPDGWVMRILNVMARTPHHTYQILTKRPERMRSFFTRWADLTGEDFGAFKNARGPEETRRAHPSPRGQLFAAMVEAMGKPPKGCAYPTFDWMQGMIRWPSWFQNIHLGVSVENQAAADERIPQLLATPAAVRFLSVEPLLGPVDLSRWMPRGGIAWQCSGCGELFPSPWRKVCPSCGREDYWTGSHVGNPPGRQAGQALHWAIGGFESGPGARPGDVAWMRALVAQCTAAGIPKFVKQLGAKPRGWCAWPHHDERPPHWLDENGVLPSVSGAPAVDLCHAVEDYFWPCSPKLKDRKGGDMSEWPDDLRVREFPR